MAIQNVQLQFRREDGAGWAAMNPVLAYGEPGISDGGIFKIGDGVTPWMSLAGYTLSAIVALPEILDLIVATLVDSPTVNVTFDPGTETISFTAATADLGFALDRANHTGVQEMTTITGLVSALAAKLSPTGAQSFSGVKTFNNGIVVPDASIPTVKISGLDADIDAAIAALPGVTLTYANALAGTTFTIFSNVDGTWPLRPTARNDLMFYWQAINTAASAPSVGSGYALTYDQYIAYTAV